MKKILITGGNGFIGRYLIKELNDHDVDYIAMDMNPISDLSPERQANVSILDSEGVGRILKKYKPDVVIHLAAIASVTHNDIGEIYKVNVCGTDILLSAINQYCELGTRVILISSAGVYGNQELEVYSEDLPFNPTNHYSYSKMITEYMSRQYADYLDIIIVRPFNIIGVGQKENFLIPKLVKCFANHEKKILVGNIKTLRDYIDVELCARFLYELAIRDFVEFKVFNVCSGIPLSGEMVIQQLEELTSFYPVVEVSKHLVREHEVWKMVGNPNRLNRFLNNTDYRGFREVLTDMLNYYTGKEQ